MRYKNFFESRLHACGKIVVALFQGLIGWPRGAQALLEIL